MHIAHVPALGRTTTPIRRRKMPRDEAASRSGVHATDHPLQLFPAGAPPPFRIYGATVVSDGAGRMILFGGRINNSSSFNDVWVVLPRGVG